MALSKEGDQAALCPEQKAALAGYVSMRYKQGVSCSVAVVLRAGLKCGFARWASERVDVCISCLSRRSLVVRHKTECQTGSGGDGFFITTPCLPAGLDHCRRRRRSRRQVWHLRVGRRYEAMIGSPTKVAASAPRFWQR